MSTLKSIGVFGGNGFLGRKICEVGVKRGYEVTAFSRSGKPATPVADKEWASKVKWEKADIFNPESYQDKLSHLDTVVHSIGTLFENQAYKASFNSNFNFLNDIKQLANFAKGANPMKKDYYRTYEAIQRDSAVILADAFLKEQKNDPSFVYISADKQIPFIPSGYITTKREAEFELRNKKGLRSIIMRPNFMYEEEAGKFNKRDILKDFLNFGYLSKNAVFGNHLEFLNNLIRPSVSTERVSETIFEKVEDKNFSGIVFLDELYNDH